ncbi:Kelch-like protein 6 [Mactra antiquata]
MSQNKSHLQVLGKGLHCQRLEGKYVDFTLISIDGTKHGCHKVVLAAVSPYFDTMFGIDMQEMQMNETDIHFDSGTVELILQYMYTGDNVITLASVPELYSAANFLQMSTLQQECEEFLMSNKAPDISLKVWQIAKLFGRFDIADIAKGNVLQNFDIFCRVDSIGEISIENLKELLLDKLTNCSGVVKSKAGWIWLIAQESPDLDCAKKIITALVSAENVDSSDIREACTNDWDQQLNDEVGIETLDCCANLWRDACDALWIEQNPTNSGVDMSLSECLIIVGGDPLDESKLTLFNYKKRQWYKVESAPRDLGHRFAVCSLGSFLYLSGGVNSPKSFLCFHADNKAWTVEENLPIGRQQHNMCTVPANTARIERHVNRQIYVLGGSSSSEPVLSDVHVYDTKDMCWRKCGEIAGPVNGACSAVVDKKIYLFGGVLTREGAKSPSNMIQCFDTETLYSWYVNLKLPMKAKSLKMSVVRPSYEISNDDVFIVHGSKIYKISLRRKNLSVEEMVTISDAPLKGFGAAGFGNRIYIFGGEDDNFRCTKNIFQFDTQSGQAVTLPSHTPFMMKDFVCCNIQVPSSWDITEYPEK